MKNLLSIKIGTRGSPLALVQANQLKFLLEKIIPDKRDIIIQTIHTSGDKIQDRTLSSVGGKGLFTKEIDEALLNKTIDIAVHSMKDVPTIIPQGIVFPAILEREDPRDGFISSENFEILSLPKATTIGTASLRRQAQLLKLRPDLKIVPLRGNIQTRLNKLNEGLIKGTLLAMAGLNRLNLSPIGLKPVSMSDMLPAVAQAAIGISCRTNDRPLISLLSQLNHINTELCITAERAFLKILDGSCRTPIAGHAQIQDSLLTITGEVLLPDGSHHVTETLSGPMAMAKQLGTNLGRSLLDKIGPHYFDIRK